MVDHSKLSLLLVQAQLSWKNPSQNRAHLESQLASSERPFDLAVFPEAFTTGFLGDPDLPPEGMDGPTVSWMKSVASEYDCAIAGSAVITEQGKRYNRFLMVTEQGEVMFYDKRHLFAFGGENTRYVAGKERVIWNYKNWRICPQVCYDLRFPVWCRNRADYDLLLFVANWPSKRVHHWMALLHTRAIENQAWVIGLNRAGEDGNGISYPGSSQVYDPSGELMEDLGSEESARWIEMDLARVAEIQTSFAFQQDADSFAIDVNN